MRRGGKMCIMRCVMYFLFFFFFSFSFSLFLFFSIFVITRIYMYIYREWYKRIGCTRASVAVQYPVQCTSTRIRYDYTICALCIVHCIVVFWVIFDGKVENEKLQHRLVLLQQAQCLIQLWRNE